MSFRTMRGIQQSMLSSMMPPRLPVIEPKGVVYTKRWVVELLLDLAGYTSKADLAAAVAVEPAAGTGAFLGPMIKRLADSCQRRGRPISDSYHSLIAYELDEQSAQRARAFAIESLKMCGVNPEVAEELAKAWVRTADYLFDSINVKADFVVGNPPYVRLEDIPEGRALLYRDAYTTMRGRADLYVAFFEAALSQLKDGGTCAFICADRWMRNQYGGELRELITSHFAVDVVIEMHNAAAFQDEVDAYPAITVIRRKKQRAVVVASAGPQLGDVPSGTISGALLARESGNDYRLIEGLRAARVDNWFKGSAPWPCHSPEQLALLRRLEEGFPALETFARVGIGVATGNDRVFITKDEHLVESSRLLRLALAKDLCEGQVRWSGHYLIDPWERDGLVDLARYPRLHAYLIEHRDALKERHTALKNTSAWYKTIDRVTHSVTGKSKLYIADIKNRFDPALDDGETYPHHNLYFVESDEWDLRVLGGLLMSSIGQFFIDSYGVRMRGGYMRFQAQYLRRIRVPNPKDVSLVHAQELIEAFRARDRQMASRTALEIFGISEVEMESAIGH
jgi:adenine-specific DNA-methyltransferase